jgi:transcriptional regulator with XRE-family HTH domain
MDNKEVFNRAEFAALLDKAKGDRSINQYANETGVSAAHISRFLREMIDAPPTPETISKLAAKAYNEVTYQDLMVAAGHLARQYDDNIMEVREDSIAHERASIIKDSPINYRIEIEYLKKRFTQIILADLYDKPFKWSPEKLIGRTRYPDMILNLYDSEYKRWCFDFKPIRDDRGFMPPNFLFIYGRIAMEEIYPYDKFTIVVNNERAFDSFFRRPPLSLRANLYVMLIDLDKGEVIKEEPLCKY